MGIELYSIVGITVLCVYLTQNVNSGLLFSAILYMGVGIIIGILCTVIEAASDVSMHRIRELLLFYQFGITINSTGTGESVMEIVCVSIISCIIHLGMLQGILHLNNKKYRT